MRVRVGAAAVPAAASDLRARRVLLGARGAAALAAVLPAAEPLLRPVRAAAPGSDPVPAPAQAWARLRARGLTGDGDVLHPALATTLAVLLAPEVLLVATGRALAPGGGEHAAVLATAGARVGVLRRAPDGPELSAVGAGAVVPELLRALTAAPAAAWVVQGRVVQGRVVQGRVQGGAGRLEEHLLHDAGTWCRRGPDGAGGTGGTGGPGPGAPGGWQVVPGRELARRWTSWLLAARVQAP